MIEYDESENRRTCIISLEEEWMLCPQCGSTKFIDQPMKKRGSTS